MTTVFTRLHANGRLTLPKAIRDAACLEDGEDLVIETTAGGILLSHKKDLERSQAWFWTPEWQKGEREADEDIAAGRLARYDSEQEFLEALDRKFE